MYCSKSLTAIPGQISRIGAMRGEMSPSKCAFNSANVFDRKYCPLMINTFFDNYEFKAKINRPD